MVKDFEFFHGVVFARILRGSKRPVSVRPFQTPSNASYVVNDSIGIYIKYSTKRMTPWRFTFKKEHHDEVDLMKRYLKRVFLVLVCNDDGMVCLSYSEFEKVLEGRRNSTEWICAARQKREMYSVSGSSGRLDLKVGQNDFPEKIFRD